MAKVLSLTTTIAALEVASEIVGPVNYVGNNLQQKWLLERYETYKNEVTKIPELEVWAKFTAEELNEILEKRGFDIRLDSWEPDPKNFGTLGILDCTLDWYSPGTNTKILDNKFDAFILNDMTILSSKEVEGEDNPLIELETQTDDIVKIIKYSEPKDEFEVIEIVEKLRNTKQEHATRFTHVIIPKVKYSQETDLEWIIGLKSGEAQIVQAMQEVRFAMNEIGARVKEATAFEILGGIAPKPNEYIFDEPFIIWVERPGIEVPVFQAWIGRDDWKDPGDLVNL